MKNRIKPLSFASSTPETRHFKIRLNPSAGCAKHPLCSQTPQVAASVAGLARDHGLVRNLACNDSRSAQASRLVDGWRNRCAGMHHRQDRKPKTSGPFAPQPRDAARAQQRRARQYCPSQRSDQVPPASMWRSRNGRIIAISSGEASRSCGGRHGMTLRQIKRKLRIGAVAPQADGGEHPVQQLPGSAHERAPLTVFLASRRIADHHHPRLRIAIGKHQVARAALQLARSKPASVARRSARLPAQAAASRARATGSTSGAGAEAAQLPGQPGVRSRRSARAMRRGCLPAHSDQRAYRPSPRSRQGHAAKARSPRSVIVDFRVHPVPGTPLSSARAKAKPPGAARQPRLSRAQTATPDQIRPIDRCRTAPHLP